MESRDNLYERIGKEAAADAWNDGYDHGRSTERFGQLACRTCVVLDTCTDRECAEQIAEYYWNKREEAS